MIFKKVVEKLTENKETIATMESCTGGGVANAITNIEGASSVLKFSAVTYSNEFKIKMGVSSEVIDKYSVYSQETAREMAKNIALFANADYGVGITGKLNRADINNNYGQDNIVYITIFNKKNVRFYDKWIVVTDKTREINKKTVLYTTDEMLGEILGIKNIKKVVIK